MIPAASRLGRLGKFVPSSKNVAWMLGGIALSTVFAVSAQKYASNQDLSLQEQCDLQKEIEQVLNRQVAQIAATSPDPSKYFVAGGDSSCLGDLSLANLDLSRLIPDPIGLLSDAVTSAVTKLTNGAVGKVCAAARNTMGDTINQYNAVVNSANNVDGSVKYQIDKAVTDQAVKTGASFGVDYRNAPASAPVDVLSGVQLKGSDVLAQINRTQASSDAGSFAAGSTQLTSAASAAEAARVDLERTRAAAANGADTVATGAVARAESVYSAATDNLSAVRNKVGNLINGQSSNQRQNQSTSQPVQPTPPATVGSSIFGK